MLDFLDRDPHRPDITLYVPPGLTSTGSPVSESKAIELPGGPSHEGTGPGIGTGSFSLDLVRREDLDGEAVDGALPFDGELPASDAPPPAAVVVVVVFFFGEPQPIVDDLFFLTNFF